MRHPTPIIATALAIALAACGGADGDDVADAGSADTEEVSEEETSEEETSDDETSDDEMADDDMADDDMADDDMADDDGADEEVSEDEMADDDMSEDETSDDETAAGATVSLSATNFEFDQTSLEVASGTTIDFTVEEGSHSFTSADAGFDTGVFASDTMSVTVDAAPGTYSYRCTLHSQMTGELTLTE